MLNDEGNEKGKTKNKNKRSNKRKRNIIARTAHVFVHFYADFHVKLPEIS